MNLKDQKRFIIEWLIDAASSAAAGPDDGDFAGAEWWQLDVASAEFNHGPYDVLGISIGDCLFELKITAKR